MMKDVFLYRRVNRMMSSDDDDDGLILLSYRVYLCMRVCVCVGFFLTNDNVNHRLVVVL